MPQLQTVATSPLELSLDGSGPERRTPERRTIETAIAGLQSIRDALAEGALGHAMERALDVIECAGGRIIVTGVGKSGHVGAKIASTLASTGAPAVFVHPTEASHGDLGMIGRDDVVLALSWSGESAELRDIVAYSRRFQIQLIALTGSGDSMLARAADVALVLPAGREACPHNLAPTTSTTMQIALGDAIAVALLERRGFTATNFRDLHPGGKLGDRLRPVSSLMTTGEHMPLVNVTATVGDGVHEMTSKGAGIVGVADDDGRLIGVVTDGDIRRYVDATADLPIREAFGGRQVSVMMTRDPVIASPDMLAETAVSKMQTLRVSAIFVVENERPVGMITLQQFLRSGVI